MRLLAILLLVAATSLSSADDIVSNEAATTEKANPQSVYLIGNSLTWDTVPSKLDGDVQWHVDCGKPLTYIHANPDMPCVKSSTLWPEALKAKQYDIISFQPHYGTEISEDIATINKWLELQPDAVIVIHTGWARQAEREQEWSDDDPAGLLTHSIAYFHSLLDTLRKQHPDREFRTTGAMLLLQAAADDIAAGNAPFQNLSELYRDAIHMNVDTGRYLTHNAMRQTLGQDRLTEWTEALTAEQRTYLDSLLDRQQELTKQLLK